MKLAQRQVGGEGGQFALHGPKDTLSAQGEEGKARSVPVGEVVGMQKGQLSQTRNATRANSSCVGIIKE